MNLTEQNKRGKIPKSQPARMHQKNSQRTYKCKGTPRFRKSQGYISLQARGVFGGHIAQCFQCSHPSFPKVKLLMWVRGRLLCKLGFALTPQSWFYIPMIANSHRGFRLLLFKAALSQVGRHEETTGQAQAKISIM